MRQLTLEERRRIFLARQRALDGTLIRRPAATPASQSAHPGQRLREMVKIAAIVTLLSAAWLASQAIEFHMPASIAEALPRL